MRENTLRTKWNSGKGTVNGWCSMPSPVAAEVMAHCGWDSITIDLQHGLIDYQAAVGMLQAISTTETIPLARVPWREAGIIMKMLDAGAYGIICPMVNTRAQAEELVSYCNYAPKGQRSFGPIRATIYGGADYGAKANETILSMAMIETKQALENLDEILSTPGLDGIYVGPADLALSMGHNAQLDPTEPKVLDAISTIIEGAKRHKIYAGIHCGSVDFAKKALGWGFNYTSMLSDSRLLTMKAVEIVQAMGSDVEGPKSSTY
ncbi:aldolase/citrate lyase family protein [Geminicoccaceae bacterium 1502E]|nr:aldolase/citrate lyase family protein [Geminicoccaceae bacterium 1502E]